MNEAKNPFEAMENAGGGIDPFENPSSGMIDLGSDAIAANPFDMPEPPPAVNTGSEGGATNPFAFPTIEATVTTTAENSTPVAIPLQPLANQSQPPNIAGDQTQPPLAAATPQVPTAPAPIPTSLFPEQATNPAETDEETQAIVQLPVFARPPVFEHGAVREDVENLTQTFEDLRVAKMEDFPELEDGNRVSWEITYGKVRKTVYGVDAKKNKIGEFKTSIETSKEFTEALKKSKEKSPVCTIKPRVTAQSKGDQLPVYKGVFNNLEEAEASGKIICIVPGSDGKVYEIRNEETGKYITPTKNCPELSEIKAGFTPALPLIPHHELRRIIAFFRSLIQDGKWYEAIANIYWDRELKEFRTVIPRQYVTPASANADLDMFDEYLPERFLHYMDIHSHNYMPARFSAQDNRDEKATRLYAVIGKLNDFIPQLSVRISNGGKYLLVDPSTVLESLGDFYPDEWNERVTLADYVNYESTSSPEPFHTSWAERHPYGEAA